MTPNVLSRIAYACAHKPSHNNDHLIGWRGGINAIYTRTKYGGLSSNAPERHTPLRRSQRRSNSSKAPMKAYYLESFVRTRPTSDTLHTRMTACNAAGVHAQRQVAQRLVSRSTPEARHKEFQDFTMYRLYRNNRFPKKEAGVATLAEPGSVEFTRTRSAAHPCDAHRRWRNGTSLRMARSCGSGPGSAGSPSP